MGVNDQHLFNLLLFMIAILTPGALTSLKVDTTDGGQVARQGAVHVGIMDHKKIVSIIFSQSGLL